MLVGALAACESGSSDDESASPKAGKAAGTKIPSGDTGGLEVPVGAVSSVSEFTCKADDAGAWSARMTLANSTDASAVYLVRAAVIKTKTSEVVGKQTKKVTIDAGDSVEVALDDIATGKHKGLACSPRVVRGDS